MCGRKSAVTGGGLEETKSIGLQHPAIDLAVTDMNWAVLILKKLYQISISLGCVTKRYSLQAFIDATYGKLVRCNAPCCSVAWRVTVYTAIICNLCKGPGTSITLLDGQVLGAFLPTPGRVRVLGEYGGLGYAVEGHRWSAYNEWGYGEKEVNRDPAAWLIWLYNVVYV